MPDLGWLNSTADKNIDKMYVQLSINMVCIHKIKLILKIVVAVVI